MNLNFLNDLRNVGRSLSRHELKEISGGISITPIGGDGACTASCNDGTVKTCSGSNCSAEDGTGCKSDLEEKKCGVPII